MKKIYTEPNICSIQLCDDLLNTLKISGVKATNFSTDQISVEDIPFSHTSITVEDQKGQENLGAKSDQFSDWDE